MWSNRGETEPLVLRQEEALRSPQKLRHICRLLGPVGLDSLGKTSSFLSFDAFLLYSTREENPHLL